MIKGGGGGGRDSGAGYDFQDVCIALELAKLLTESERPRSVEVFWEKKVLDFGDGVPRHVSVDDLIVQYESDKWRFTQVKKAGGWTVAAFKRDLMPLLLQQWQEANASGKIVQIRLRLVTGGTIKTELSQIVNNAGTVKTFAELEASLGEYAQDDLKELTSGLSLADAALMAFLKALEIKTVESVEQVHGWTVLQLRSGFGERAHEVAEHLERLVARSKQPGEAARTQHTRESLMEQLEAEGFSCEALRRRRAVRVRDMALAATGLALAVVAWIVVSLWVSPASWHRRFSTEAALLPLATWVGSPLHPLEPSLVDSRNERAQRLTGQLANQIEQTTAIRLLQPGLASAIARSVGWDGKPCVGPVTLEQIRQLTGVTYVVTGFLDPADKPNILTTCVQRTLDGKKTLGSWQLGAVDVEVVGGDLSRQLEFSLLRALRSGRQDLYKPSPDALAQWVDGVEAFQDFNMLRALRSLYQATNSGPKFYLAHYAFSQVLQERGRDEAAEDEATKALQIFKEQHGRNDREMTLLEAQVHAARGELRRAADLYLGLWHHDPSDFRSALLAVETQNLALMSDDALQQVDKLRELENQRDVQLPPDIDIRFDLEEAEAAGQAGDFRREEQAARAALAKHPHEQSRLASRARYLACDAAVQRQETEPGKIKLPWPPECNTAKRSFYDAGDLINYGKLLQLEAKSLRESDSNCALAKDRLAVDAFRAEQFERGLVDQLTNLAGTLTLTESPSAPQYREAGMYCAEAIQKSCQAGSLHLPEVLTDCAYLYFMTGNPKLAETMYTDAGLIASQRKDNSTLAAIKGNLAYLKHARGCPGCPEAAARMYEDSLAVSARLGESDSDLAETRVRYARLLSDLGKEERARELYQNGTRYLTAKDLLHLLKDMQKVLAKSSNGVAWQRIAAHPSPPLPPLAKYQWECTDEPLMPSRPDAGVTIPASTRPAGLKPLSSTLETCKNLPLPPLQIP
jgi:hypothetical protein